jgi:hypothetical protein
MSKWLKVGTLATLVAVVALMALGTGAAFAQGPAGTAPRLGMGLGPRWGGTGGIGGPQNSLVAAAAQTLGMDQVALVAELNKGKTIADVAKEKNIDTTKIVDAVLALRTQALKTAVDAKRITQAQADAALANMKTQITAQISAKFSPRGYGMGLGFVDANNDGICDNWGANRPAGQFFGPRGRWTR